MIDFSLQGSRHIGGCNQLLPSDLLLKSVQQIVTANAVHGILVPCRWLFPLSAKGNPLLAEPAEPYEACRSWKLFLALFTLSSLKQRTCHCRWFLWNSLIMSVRNQASLASPKPLLSSIAPTWVFCLVCCTSGLYGSTSCATPEKGMGSCTWSS